MAEQISSNAVHANKRNVAIAIVVALALLLAAFVATERAPFVSAEVNFADASQNGLAIVPASCPSNPFDSDAPFGCSGETPLCPTGLPAPNGDLTQCPCTGSQCSTGVVPVGVPTGGSGNPPGGGTIVTTIQCGVGYIQEGTNCVFNACPVGYTENVVNGNPECDFTGCPVGDVYSNGSCTFSSCPTGYTQEGQSCVQVSAPPPSGSITAHPAIVQTGDTTQIIWGASSVSSCLVSGTNGDNWNCTGQACNDETEPTRAIENQVVYTLSCTGLDNSSFATSTVVNVVPNFQEH